MIWLNIWVPISICETDNLPSLGPWLTIIPLMQNMDLLCVCVQDSSYHCTFSWDVTQLLFVQEILPFESGKSNHQGSALSQVTVCTSETENFATESSSVSCILAYLFALLAACIWCSSLKEKGKKKHKNQNNGCCLLASISLCFHPRTQNSSATSSTAAQGLVFYHTPRLLDRHEAGERNRRLRRGSFTQPGPGFLRGDKGKEARPGAPSGGFAEGLISQQLRAQAPCSW